MKNIYILVALMCLSLQTMTAQEDKRDVRRGNRNFKKEEYREADIEYRKALVKDSTSVAANYNLANTLYRLGDMEQARKSLDRVKDSAPATEAASDYYYNLGDVAIALQDWQGAVDAFEQSLLRNPGDLQAKENYIYAKKKLQEQQNQQNQNDQNQNDQNQNDQNQNDQNQQDGKNDQDGQNQQDKNDDRKDKEKENENENDDENRNDQNQPKPQQSPDESPKITPQAAQQMLQAIQEKEKETQDKVKKEKAAALKSRQKDKNW